MSKKLIISVFVFALSITAFYSCEHSPQATPTTPVISKDSCGGKIYTYDSTIVKLVSANCTNSCHKPGASASFINLTTYNNVKNITLNGDLIDRITTQNSNELMPPFSRMPDSTVQKFKCWKANGCVK